MNNETMFRSKPKEYSTLMAEKDHPELDDSELLDSLDTLGRFDIHLGIATVSSFHVAPC
jgi:hypothetical protein